MWAVDSILQESVGQASHHESRGTLDMWLSRERDWVARSRCWSAIRGGKEIYGVVKSAYSNSEEWVGSKT